MYRYCRRLSKWNNAQAETGGPVTFEPFHLAAYSISGAELVLQGQAFRTRFPARLCVASELKLEWREDDNFNFYDCAIHDTDVNGTFNVEDDGKGLKESLKDGRI